MLSNRLEISYLDADQSDYTVSYPAEPFGTYEWLFPFDDSQPWTVTGGMTCLTFTGANVPDSSSLGCQLDHSATWLGIDFLDPNGDPLANAFATSASGQNYNVAYEPFIGNVPEPTSWAMLIAGFGLVGAMARRRRMVAA